MCTAVTTPRAPGKRRLKPYDGVALAVSGAERKQQQEQEGDDAEWQLAAGESSGDSEDSGSDGSAFSGSSA